jgi:hypothetical protein
MRGRGFTGAGDAITVDVVLLAGAGLGLYFLVIKPLLSGLGVDPQSQATIDAEKALPAAQNPFNYQFQPWVDFYNNNTPQINTGGQSLSTDIMAYLNMAPVVNTNSNPTMQQFFIALKQVPPASSPWATIDVVALSALAEQLNSAINGFTLTVTDQTAAMSPLSGLTSQMQMAFIANYFWWNFNLDLLTDLQGSLFKQGLTPQNLAVVINAVNALPVQPVV